MKLSFADRISWDARGATIPQLTDAEIDEVLRAYRPTMENPVCDCAGVRVCVACILTQVIDQVRKRHRVMTMLGVEFGYKCAEKGRNLDYTMAKAGELYDGAKEFARCSRPMRNDD